MRVVASPRRYDRRHGEGSRQGEWKHEVKSSDDRRWDPFDSDDLAVLLSGYVAPWWVGGGVALDVFVGTRARSHFDVDVWVLRRDAPHLRNHLAGWDLRVGIPGKSDHDELPVWSQRFDSDRMVHGVWAEPPTANAGRLEFLLQDTVNDSWQSRYHSSVIIPLSNIGEEMPGGLPIVRPELVLLYKSARLREVDEKDFRMVVPRLGPARREYLSTLLKHVDPKHPWLPTLDP